MLLQERLLPGPGFRRFSISCFFAALVLAPSSGQQAPSDAAIRKEGAWEVTQVGDVHKFGQTDERLLVAARSRPPELWDTRSGKRVALLKQHRGELQSFAFSPDGKRLLTAQVVDREAAPGSGPYLRHLYLWDARDGVLLKTIDFDLNHKIYANTARWDVDWMKGDQVLVRMFVEIEQFRPPGTVTITTLFSVLDLATGNTVPSATETAGGRCLIAPDGMRFLAGRMGTCSRGPNGEANNGVLSDSLLLDLIDLSSLQRIKTLVKFDSWQLEQSRDSIRRAWSSDGRWLATAAPDGWVVVWDSQNGARAFGARAHGAMIFDMRFTPDSRSLLTVSDDGTAKLWEIGSGKVRQTFTGHTMGLTVSAFNSTGHLLLTGAEDETARLWDVKTGKMMRAFPAHESGVREVKFIAGEQQIETVTAEGVQRTWSLADGSLLDETAPLMKHEKRAGLLKLRNTMSAKRWEIWSAPAGSPLPMAARPPAPRKIIRTFKHTSEIALLFDGKTVAAVSKNDVDLWDTEQWNKVTGAGRSNAITFRVDGQPGGIRIQAMSVALDGKTLAVGLDDGSVLIADPATRKQLAAFPVKEGFVTRLALSSDRSLLAVASNGAIESLEMWNIATKTSLWRSFGGPGTGEAVAFNPKGELLALPVTIGPLNKQGTANRHIGIRLANAVTGKEIRTLDGFRGRVRKLHFSLGGKLLAATSADGTARVWEVATGKLRHLFRHDPGDDVFHLAISPDDQLLATGSFNRENMAAVLRLWDLESGIRLGAISERTGSLIFTPDSATLITCSDHTIKLWDVAQLTKQK